MATPSPAPTVYSTGQTPEDIKALINLALLSGQDLSTIKLPPVLSDPNYQPPTANRNFLNAFTITTATIATIAIIIRLYVRTLQCRFRYSMDDICILLGYLTFLSLWILTLVGVNAFQWGSHTYDMKINSLLFDYKLLYIYEILFAWALSLIRLALLFLLSRLFKEASRGFRILNGTLIWCNLAYAVCSTLAFTFQCGEVRAAWDVYTKFKIGCRPLYVYYIVGAFQLALDVASVLVPVKLVSALKGLTMRKRMEVLVMFSLGLSACFAAVARMFFLAPVVEGLDTGRATINLTIACQLEGTLAIIAACIPMVRQFFVALFKKKGVLDFTDKVKKSLRSVTASSNSATLQGSRSAAALSSSSRASQSVHIQSGNGKSSKGSFALSSVLSRKSTHSKVGGGRASTGAEGTLTSQQSQHSQVGDRRSLAVGYGVRISSSEEEEEIGRESHLQEGTISRDSLDGNVASTRDYASSAEVDLERNVEEPKAARPWNRYLASVGLGGRLRIPSSSYSQVQSRSVPTLHTSPPPASSPTGSDFDGVRGSRPFSPPRSTPGGYMLGVERPTLHISASFESGVASSTNSLELSQWDTLENHHPEPLTPRPASARSGPSPATTTAAERGGSVGSTGTEGRDWRDSIIVD